MLNFRAPAELIERLDAWAVSQTPELTRSEAIRKILEIGLSSKR
jgi:hypothetical protein